MAEQGGTMDKQTHGGFSLQKTCKNMRGDDLIKVNTRQHADQQVE